MILNKTYLTADQYIEYTCEVADKIMQMKFGKSYNRYVKNIGKDITYTDEGQNIFNEILDNVEEFLADVGIYPESEEDRLNVIPR